MQTPITPLRHPSSVIRLLTADIRLLTYHFFRFTGSLLLACCWGSPVLGADGSDTAIRAWGRNNSGQLRVPADLTNLVAVSARGNFTLALRRSGEVVAWRDNSEGATNLPPDLTNVIAISAGYGHGLALHRDGTVVTWGRSGYGVGVVPNGITNVVGVAAGFFVQRTSLIIVVSTLLTVPFSGSAAPAPGCADLKPTARHNESAQLPLSKACLNP